MGNFFKHKTTGIILEMVSNEKGWICLEQLSYEDKMPGNWSWSGNIEEFEKEFEVVVN